MQCGGCEGGGGGDSDNYSKSPFVIRLGGRLTKDCVFRSVTLPWHLFLDANSAEASHSASLPKNMPDNAIPGGGGKGVRQLRSPLVILLGGRLKEFCLRRGGALGL